MEKSKIRSKLIRNFRGVACVILLMLLLGIGGCQSDDAAPPVFANLRVFVDYKDLSANDDAQVFSSGATYGEYKGDTLMLPFYPIAQRLGYAVFDGTVTKPDEIISLRMGDKTAAKNGVALPTMTVAPYLSGEELMVSADFLSDAFGVRIEKICLEEVREPSTRFDAVMIHTFAKPTPLAKARVFDMANEYLFTYVPGMRQGERLTSPDVSSLHTNLLGYAFYYDFFNDTDMLFDWADDEGCGEICDCSR